MKANKHPYFELFKSKILNSSEKKEELIRLIVGELYKKTYDEIVNRVLRCITPLECMDADKVETLAACTEKEKHIFDIRKRMYDLTRDVEHWLGNKEKIAEIMKERKALFYELKELE